MDNSNASQQIALYEDPDHAVHLDVRVDGDTVWLTQQQMATLFGRGVRLSPSTFIPQQRKSLPEFEPIFIF